MTRSDDSFSGPAPVLKVPGQEVFAQVWGEPVHYLRMGSGPLVVLLHGLGEAALVWYATLPALAERFTVYAPDLLGHGRSGRIRPPYTLERGASFVVQFLDAVGAPSAHLVGNSLGGLLVLSTAQLHPTRVRSLVLEDSAGLGRETAGFLRAMTLPGVGDLMARPSRQGIRRMLRILFHDPTLIPDGLVAALYQERRRPGNAEAMLALLRSGVTVRGVRTTRVVTDRLAALGVPTLVLWGRQDRVFPVGQAEEAVRRLPHGRLHVFDRCGHWPHIEHKDEFNRVVMDFLLEQEPRSS